jgi:hypothetical protein
MPPPPRKPQDSARKVLDGTLDWPGRGTDPLPDPEYQAAGRTVLHFAGWKEHVSLYPATARLVAALCDESAAFDVQDSTLHFPLTRPIPVRVIEREVPYAGSRHRRPIEGRGMEKEDDEEGRSAGRNAA